jgi:hypothetical protein
VDTTGLGSRQTGVDALLDPALDFGYRQQDVR